MESEVAARAIEPAVSRNAMEPAATEKAANPRGVDENAVGNGGGLTKLRFVGNKGREGGVADKDAGSDTDLKLGMTTPS